MIHSVFAETPRTTNGSLQICSFKIKTVDVSETVHFEFPQKLRRSDKIERSYSSSCTVPPICDFSLYSPRSSCTVWLD